MIKVAKPTRGGTVRVTFTLPAREPAGAVSVVGDFNDWDPFAHPLRKRSNGGRSAVVTVPAGATLHFRYLAEGGHWFDDDTAGTPQSGWRHPHDPGLSRTASRPMPGRPHQRSLVNEHRSGTLAKRR